MTMKQDIGFRELQAEEQLEEVDLQRSKEIWQAKMEAWEALNIPFDRNSWLELMNKADLILEKIKQRKSK